MTLKINSLTHFKSYFSKARQALKPEVSGKPCIWYPTLGGRGVVAMKPWGADGAMIPVSATAEHGLIENTVLGEVYPCAIGGITDDGRALPNGYVLAGDDDGSAYAVRVRSEPVWYQRLPVGLKIATKEGPVSIPDGGYVIYSEAKGIYFNDADTFVKLYGHD